MFQEMLQFMIHKLNTDIGLIDSHATTMSEPQKRNQEFI